MKVTLRLHETSEPLFFTDVQNAYTKGPLYCLRMQDTSTLKIPLVSIFSIKEEQGYSSQHKNKGKK